MADGGSFTQTGLEAFKAAVATFPDNVMRAQQVVARRTGQAMQNDARRKLLAQLKTPTHALANAIEVREDFAHNLVEVISFPPIGQPTSVNIWNEYGTAKMPARPYMRPAADAAQAQYARDLQAAVDSEMAKAFGE